MAKERKKYTKVSDEQRKNLLKLITQENQSISQAAHDLGIYYPTAKAIMKVYRTENRT